MYETLIKEIKQKINIHDNNTNKVIKFLDTVSYYKITTYLDIVSNNPDIMKQLKLKESFIEDSWDVLEFLFKYNIRLSMSIYPYIHLFELILKNKVHNLLIKTFGETWYKNEEFFKKINSKTAEYLTECINDVLKTDNPLKSIENKTTLGFWTSIITSPDLWNSKQVDLKKIFDKSSISASLLKQNEINRKLTNIRLLRNNIAHYDCIIVNPVYKSVKNTYYLWNVYQDILYLFDLMGVQELKSLIGDIHCQPNKHCQGNSFETLYNELDFVHDFVIKDLA